MRLDSGGATTELVHPPPLSHTGGTVPLPLKLTTGSASEDGGRTFKVRL
jgi:hypothetical protein